MATDNYRNKITMPKISIVTVCYNDLQNLRKTINSVHIQQLGPNLDGVFEQIIIDGNSTDGTKEYIEKIKDSLVGERIDFKYISEPDNGIYDAMNKGLKIASGEWVIFLNAGDVFHNELVIAEIIKQIRNGHNADVIYGNSLKYNDWIEQYVTPPDLSNLKYDMILCHQSIFFRRNIHLKYPYSLKYKIASDYNTVLKMYLDGLVFEYMDIYLVDYDMNGFSATNLCNTFKEIYNIRRDAGVIQDNFSDKLWYIYGLIKRKFLSSLPQRFRWQIVRLKRKFVHGEALR